MALLFFDFTKGNGQGFSRVNAVKFHCFHGNNAPKRSKNKKTKLGRDGNY